MTRGARSQHAPGERAALVGLTTRRTRAIDPETHLDELAGLAEAAGATVVLRLTQERTSPDSTTFVGHGKAELLARACDEADANLVIVDHELTPAQVRNLEKICGRRILDRTEVILDIFARRARTREGKLQVELAQLQYRLPRLAGSSEALSRLGGGIGTRGPGETKLETDRRRIRQRIAALKVEIDEVGRRRAYLRTRRKRSDVPVVALVGYTNAGKTTLFNLLTGAGAVASHALFVTLDPLVRRVKLPDARQVLLSDTVGFIDRLPHQLVAAFRATLEEVAAADLLLHVIDSASPDRERQVNAVRDVLAEVGADRVPAIEVFNKIDRLAPDDLARLRAGRGEALFVSATDAASGPPVVEAVSRALAMDAERVRLLLSPALDHDRRLLAQLYREGRVLSQEAHGDTVTVEADVPRRLLPRLRQVRVPA